MVWISRNAFTGLEGRTNAVLLLLHILVSADENGEYTASLKQMSEGTGLTVRNIRTALSLLITEGRVTKKATKKATREATNPTTSIIVCDFESYKRTRKRTDKGSDKGSDTGANTVGTEVTSSVTLGKPQSDYERFVQWCSENAPRVMRMKEPLTEKQFTNIRQDFNSRILADVVLAMQNCAELHKKYVSANLTIRNWAKRRAENPERFKAENPQPPSKLAAAVAQSQRMDEYFRRRKDDTEPDQQSIEDYERKKLSGI